MTVFRTFRPATMAGLAAMGLAATPAAAVQQTVTFGYVGAQLQTFVAPVTGDYDIYAAGAAGGDSSAWTNAAPVAGGKGAIVGGQFELSQGEVLDLLVGGMGGSGAASGDRTEALYEPNGGGGGGGTFVRLNGALLIAAGGGGGAGTEAAFLGGDGVLGARGTAFGLAVGGIAGSGGSAGAELYKSNVSQYQFGGGGGGGVSSNGNSGGFYGGVGGSLVGPGYANGGQGGAGGYGGGGSASLDDGSGGGGGGGGGGYSGGGGGDYHCCVAIQGFGTFIDGLGGGGGGSFNASASPLLSFAGANAGAGEVELLFDDGVGSMPAVPEPGAWALMLIGLGGVGAALRRRAAPGAPDELTLAGRG